MPIHEPDAQDPMELMGVAVPGDMRRMAECVVEEYLLMGCSDEELLALFQDPFYGAVHMIYAQHGEAYVRELIADVRGGWQA